MSAKHTPGPWSQGVDLYEEEGPLPEPEPNGELIGPQGEAIGRVYSSTNADRIVACVNGCESIPDPSAVPELVKAARRFAAYFQDGFQDDMQCDHGAGLCGCSTRGEFEIFLAALAKLEGPKRNPCILHGGASEKECAAEQEKVGGGG